MKSARVAALVLAVCTLLALTACGENSEETGPGDTGHEHPTGQGPVPGAIADDSIHEALSRIYSWEPATERDSGVAMRKALPWLSGELAQAASRAGDDRMRPMRQWALWRAEKSIVTATVTVVPSVTDPASKTTQRRASVLQQIQRVDGSVDAYTLMTYEVDAALDPDDCWRVWRLNIIDSQPLKDGVSQ